MNIVLRFQKQGLRHDPYKLFNKIFNCIEKN